MWVLLARLVFLVLGPVIDRSRGSFINPAGFPLRREKREKREPGRRRGRRRAAPLLRVDDVAASGPPDCSTCGGSQPQLGESSSGVGASPASRVGALLVRSRAARGLAALTPLRGTRTLHLRDTVREDTRSTDVKRDNDLSGLRPCWASVTGPCPFWETVDSGSYSASVSKLRLKVNIP